MKGARDMAQVRIRFPADLKEKIQQEAERSGRSMSSEVVVCMRERYEKAEKTPQTKAA